MAEHSGLCLVLSNRSFSRLLRGSTVRARQAWRTGAKYGEDLLSIAVASPPVKEGSSLKIVRTTLVKTKIVCGAAHSERSVSNSIYGCAEGLSHSATRLARMAGAPS